MRGNRVISIDILKFLAVLLIINSHADIMYPDNLRMLATGGAIGDVIFLFCSGYTLFRKDLGRFDNWYKRRINRIYPTVMGIAIVADVVFGNKDTFVHSVILGGEKAVLERHNDLLRISLSDRQIHKKSRKDGILFSCCCKGYVR